VTEPADELEELRAQVSRLRAHEEMRGRLFAYARALDRLDRELLEAQFWPDAQVDYGGFYQGPVSGFIDTALRFQGAMRDTQHLIGNIAIDSAQDTARVESYVHANHVLLDGETLVQLMVGARYLDRFERRGALWKLSFRAEVMDWGRWVPIQERWFELARDLPKGLRGRADLSYRFALNEG
jgi:hypothetical protein